MKATKSTKRSIQKGLCAWGLIFLLLTSCSPKKITKPPPLSAGQVGTLGLAMATFPPRINLKEITEGKVEGAKNTAKWMTGKTLEDAGSSGEAVILQILLAPVMCLGGCVYGTVAAKPAKETRKQRETLKERIPALSYQRPLADSLGKALKLAQVNVSQEEVVGPASPDAEVDYSTASGVDTVLEAAVTGVGLLSRRPTKNKNISFEVLLLLRFYRASDNTLLLERNLKSKTRETRLSAWAGEGKVLEEELLGLIDKMAARAVRETFFPSVEKKRAWWQGR